MKTGLSGIVRRYGFQNMQGFYRTYHKAYSAYADYQDKVTKWEEIYGENVQKQKEESLHGKLQNYQKNVTDLQEEHTFQRKSRGAR